MPLGRLGFRGAGAKCTATSAVGIGTTAIPLTGDTSGWPTGGDGFLFGVTVDRGVEGKLEKMLAVSLVSGVLNISSRGVDGTTAIAHDAGATFELGILATWFDDVAAHIYDITRDDHTQYFKPGVDLITGANIADATINGNKIADTAITGPKINDGEITAAKMAASAQLVQVCTSGTRPGTPTQGMTIYETDTGKLLEYQGATDTWTPPWSTAWGYVSSAAFGSDVGPSTNFDTGPSLTLTSIANRRWRITMFQLLLAASANTQSFSIVKVSTGAAVMNGGLGSQFHPSTSFAIGSPVVGWLTTLAESITLKASMVTSSGGNFTSKGTTSPGFIVVEDMGPAGAPA